VQQPPYGGPPQGGHGQQPFGQPGYQQQQQWPQQQQQQQQPGYPGQGQWPGQGSPGQGFQQPPKKKGKGCLIAAVIGAVLLGSCGVLVAVSSGGSASKAGSEPVKGSIPDSKKEYEGSWVGPGVSLRIEHDGTLHYERKTGGKSTSLNGIKIDRFEKDNFVVDLFFTTTVFEVSEPPAEKDGKWKMTVDGIELTRAGSADDEFDAAASVNCKQTEKGFDCTVKHTGGTTALKACWDIEIACKNGKSPSASACEKIEIGGEKVHTFPTSDVDPGKACDQVTGMKVKNTKLSAP